MALSAISATAQPTPLVKLLRGEPVEVRRDAVPQVQRQRGPARQEKPLGAYKITLQLKDFTLFRIKELFVHARPPYQTLGKAWMESRLC